MFEHHSPPPISRWRFIGRFVRSVLMGLAIIFGSLLLGMWGYIHYEKMSQTDAFLNASMLLSGMGPMNEPKAEAGKLFAGWYALYSGFVMILASGVVFAPLIHRMLHRFHSPHAHHVLPLRATVAVLSSNVPPGSSKVDPE